MAATKEKQRSDTQSAERVRNIPKKEPIQPLKRVKVDFRAGWALFVLVVGAIIFAIGGSTPQSWIFVGSLALLWVALLGVKPHEGHKTTSLSYGFRTGNKKLRDATGNHEHTSTKPLMGELVGSVSPRQRARDRKEVIRRLGNIDLIPYDTGRGPLGISHDKRDKTYAATARLTGHSITMQDPDVRELWMEGYARTLDSVVDARSLVWQLRTFLGEQTSVSSDVRHLRQAMDLARENPPNHEVLERRGNAEAASSIHHELTMTLVLADANISGKTARLAGSKEQVLANRLKSFHAMLMGDDGVHSPLGLTSAPFLTYNKLVREMHWALDPVGAADIWRTWAGPINEFDLIEEHLAYPDTADFKSSDEWCRLGKTYRMGFYVERFARSGMRSEHFWKILGLEIPKTITVTHHTVIPGWGRMRAEWAANAQTVRLQDKTTEGGRATGFDVVALNRVEQQEQDLAEEKGYLGEMRLFIDLPGRSLEEVKRSAAVLQNAATGADFILKPLDRRQHLGVDAVMPIGRGYIPTPVPVKE